METNKKITGGIYLIANAALEQELLLNKLNEALKSGVSIVQLYNTENESLVQSIDINLICSLCHQYKVPVLVNNNWSLLDRTLLDGVHFDKIPIDFEEIKNSINKNFLTGITCSNDLEIVKWANEQHFNYISFCSMFPSSTANSCELVAFETIKKAREITQIPFFVAGGINLTNINQLAALPVSGIAVISGIMGAIDIANTTQNYITELNKITTI